MDPSGIDVVLTPEPDQGQVSVRWTSDRGSGTLFQVYANGVLQETTPHDRTVLPWPVGSRLVVEVVSVAPGEAGTDFSASLPAVPGEHDRVLLEWLGGRYLDPGPDGLYDDVAEFRVYRSAAPGGSVDISAAAAVLPLYEGGPPRDGFGVGGFGRGGFGRSQTRHRWRSGRLASGAWAFQVRAFDRAGNPGALVGAQTATIVAAPRPPRADAQGRRLRATLDATTGLVTLAWDQET